MATRATRGAGENATVGPGADDGIWARLRLRSPRGRQALGYGGALTGRRVPLYERSGEGERASARGLVALAQSGGEDAGPARPDGDES